MREFLLPLLMNGQAKEVRWGLTTWKKRYDKHNISEMSTTGDKFLFGDSRLCDYELERIVKNVFSVALSAGRFEAEDIEFLQLWDSGTYFQTAPVPVLFPYDNDVADVAKSTKNYFRFEYHDDITVECADKKFRILKLRGEKALAVLLNWLKERGISATELLMGGCCPNATGEIRDLGLGKSPLKRKAKAPPKRTTRLLSAKESSEIMASIKRHSNGLILASDVKAALNMQLRKHGYTPSLFAQGAGLNHSLVMGWRKGLLMITPEELKRICGHLGVTNLFEHLPCSVLTKEQKKTLETSHRKADAFANEDVSLEEEAYKEEVKRIQPIFDRLKSHPGFYEAARYGCNELERLVWRAIEDEKVEGSLSVEELLDSMGDEGVMGGTWIEIVDSWRHQYWENKIFN